MAEPRRRRLRAATSAVAVLLVWAVLVAPDQLELLSPAAFLAVPAEGLVLVALVAVLPPRPGRLLAAAAGMLLGLLAVVKLLDLAFYEETDRPFNPVTDWGSLGPAIGVLRDSLGGASATVAVVAAALLGAVVAGTVALAVRRVGRVAARHRGGAGRAAGVLAIVWVLCAAVGVEVAGTPVASRGTAVLAADQVRAGVDAVRDRGVFAARLAADDPFAGEPGTDLLGGLRGKDVIVAFVESYGRVAVEDPAVSPGVHAVLTAGTRSLAAAGFAARSAFLTSPTFGGRSWLAHATLQSGLWVDSQQRYDQLLAGDRLTLTAAFGRAGWRTVDDVPSNRGPWVQGREFYGFDQQYNRHQVGYAGPKFSYAAMPDQYTLAAFRRLELAPGHAPVMAEIDLVSSHTPWTPLPRMLPWDQVGDGSVYRGMPAEGLPPGVAWQDDDRVRALYGESIEYSLSALISFVTTYGDDDLVLVLVGDHQPARVVTGAGATHDVPVTIVARDPAVLARVAPWGWDDGLLPGPDAPLWPMDAFRDRFLAAFGSAPA